MSILKSGKANDRDLHQSEILRICREYFKEHNNLAIPQEYIYKDTKTQEEIPFGRVMERVKKHVRNESDYIFSDELIEELLSMDPRVFEEKYVENLHRELKEAKILLFAKEYFSVHGNLAISARYVHKSKTTDEIFNLGKEICCIKEFRKGVGKRHYDQEFMDQMEEIDPRVFEENYAKNLKGRSF